MLKMRSGGGQEKRRRERGGGRLLTRDTTRKGAANPCRMEPELLYGMRKRKGGGQARCIWFIGFRV